MNFSLVQMPHVVGKIQHLFHTKPFKLPSLVLLTIQFIGDENRKPDTGASDIQNPISTSTNTVRNQAPLSATHRKAISVDVETTRLQSQFAAKPEVFPSNYPLELKTQEAQFRMLFPNVSREDKVLLVFRAAWNPNEQQEFPGRVYVTQNDIYFYSHHLGLVLISGVAMDSITEVTAAPGKDCDFIFLHLREGASSTGFTRITIKTFLEPLRLLQSRLNYLVDISQSKQPLSKSWPAALYSHKTLFSALPNCLILLQALKIQLQH